MALPFLALLITPAAPVHGSVPQSFLWAPVTAVVAVACALAADACRDRLVPVPPAQLTPGAPEPPRTRARRWLDAPVRMAVQMAVGLGTALAVGHCSSATAGRSPCSRPTWSRVATTAGGTS